MEVGHVLQYPRHILMPPLHGAFPEGLLGRSPPAHEGELRSWGHAGGEPGRLRLRSDERQASVGMG